MMLAFLDAERLIMAFHAERGMRKQTQESQIK